MKKSLPLFLISLFLISNLNAQITLDTLSSRYVGPGVLYSDIIARSVPWTIKVLRVDLKNKFISTEAVKAKETYFGLERTSAMSKRRDYSGHTVIGAVNADYYDTKTYAITNIQVDNGEIYRGPVKSSLLGFDINNKPMIDICTLNANVFTSDSSLKINQVNQSRGNNQLILYNFYKGDSTGTNSFGTEVLIRPLSAWLVNDTLKCVVESVEENKGNMPIPKGKAVLSGHGTAQGFLSRNFHAGDTVKLYMGLTPGISKIKELIGGHPRLVKDGANYLDAALNTDKEPGSSTLTREPRSFAGISKDSTYLYLITLDGRQTSSAGATLAESADLIIRLGVYQGFNLDGGGSTTMVLRNNVMNSPSDGNERSVSNCLLVVSSAPNMPDSLEKVAFTYNYNKYLIYSLDKLQLDVYGNDKYNNPVQLDPSLMTFSVTPGLGTVDKNGLFTAASTGKKGYLYVKYKNFSDSSYIELIPLNKIVLSPKTSMIDATNPLQLKISGYANDNIERILQGKELTWKSSDSTVASVDLNGLVMGKSEGKTKITASLLGTIADTVDVTVQIGKGTALADKMESLDTWTLTGSGIDLNASKLSVSNDSKTEGTGSFKIDYSYTYNPAVASSVYLNNTAPFYGLPDSVLVDARSDKDGHKMFLVVINDQNKSFRINAVDDISSSGGFRTFPMAFKDNVPLNNGTFTFPVKLSKIVIHVESDNPNRVSGQTYSGTIYLDNLRLKYPSGTTAVKEEENNFPKDFSLKQNYPNPFNPSTVIEFSTVGQENTTLKVYDLLGREVAVLVNGIVSAGNHKAVWNAENNPSGVYFYRLQSGSYSEIKKMLLVR